MIAVLMAAALAFAQETPPATYGTQTDLVLVPFHVERGKYYVSGLTKPDIVLLEDGAPRSFTIFEGPATETRTLELVLLFDTSRFARPNGVYDLNLIYGFLHGWNEEMSQAILEQGKANVKASLYRYDENQMQRLCRSTADPRELLGAFQRLLTPIPASEAIALNLPPRRDGQIPVLASAFPAVIGTLKDSTSAADRLNRSMVVFSMGAGFLHPSAEDVADLAADLGIPIYSVVLDPNLPSDSRNLPQSLSGQIPLRKLADLTGGSTFEVTAIDANRLRDILESVKNEGLSQYIVGFAPPSTSGPPRQHKLEIRLVSKASGKLLGGKRSAIY